MALAEITELNSTIEAANEEMAKLKEELQNREDQNMAVFQYSTTTAPPSPYDYRWRKDAAGPLLLFFEGIMTSGFLQKILYALAKEKLCGRSWVCNEQNMCCTELCPCQGSDLCMNPFWRSREYDRDSEGDEENDAD